MRAHPEFDVSVIIPAHRAEATIVRSVRSALSSTDVRAEVIVVADDGRDYARALAEAGLNDPRVRHAGTPHPQSGPSTARNIGMEIAQADLIAFLDADDFYPPDRLARLAPLARASGAATGPCVAVTDTTDPELQLEAARNTPDPGITPAQLPLGRVIGARQAFSPVLHRAFAVPWRQVRFAEDLIFNAELHHRSPGYVFDPSAAYGYVQTSASRSRGAGSLKRALSGYGDILGMLFELDLCEHGRSVLFDQLQTDIDTFGRAFFEGRTSWQDECDRAAAL